MDVIQDEQVVTPLSEVLDAVVQAWSDWYDATHISEEQAIADIQRFIRDGEQCQTR